MKKGFTLIELLGVIVIIGLIVTIIAPKVNESLKNAKEKTYSASLNALVREAEEYYLEKKSDLTTFNGCTYNFTANTNTCSNFTFKGKKPEKGTLTIGENGAIVYALKIDKKCYKYYNQKDIEITEYNSATCKIDAPSDFSTDSWETVIAAVKTNNTSNYNIGDTKDLYITSFGNHTVRIANMSTPKECNNPGFSQTACGFVLEFTDIITMHRMNPYNEESEELGNGNIGDWEYTETRQYLNNYIYTRFPEELKNSILDTYVVSGLYKDSSNISTTIDKLYLLAFSEIQENQTAEKIEYSRPLDYYHNKNHITYYKKNYLISVDQNWWLRNAWPMNVVGAPKSYFEYMQGSLSPLPGTSTYEYGISPAFRL